MADPREWISRIKGVGPPDLWPEVEARAETAAWGVAAGPTGAGTGAPSAPRRAALVTGVAAGLLALTLVVVGLRGQPPSEERETPTPEPSTLVLRHEQLERLLSELWIAEAYRSELQGAIEKGQEELDLLRDQAGANPTEAQLREIEREEERIAAWTRSLERYSAEISTLQAAVEQVREARALLLPPEDPDAYPDVASVACDGDGTGGTHLSTPVVRSRPDGVHLRVVNRLSNERVFLSVQPDGVRAISAGETVTIILPPRPSHDVKIECTYEYPRGSWERPTHPLWIAGDAACPSPPIIVSQLPWLEDGAVVPPPESIDERPDSGFVWFEDPEQRFAGAFVALKRSPWSPFRRDFSGFPSTPVRGTTGHLVWVGDPGVGELSLVWREAGSSCEWYTLSISSLGLIQAQAEEEIRDLAGSLVEGEDPG